MKLNKRREVHNGKGRVKRRRTNERYVGRRWGERIMEEEEEEEGEKV